MAPVSTPPRTSPLASPARLLRGRWWGAHLAVAVAVGAALVYVVLGGTLWGRAPSPVAGTVVRATIDGDTVRVDIDGVSEDVRLIGIDTPETVHPTRPVECFGPEASAHIAELLPEGTAVVLERDTEERDHFGRLLAYVLRAADGLFVNEAMVRAGYAEVLTIAPNVAHTATFTAAAAEARREGRGLWVACSGAVPSGP
jgi:micrococcal nuclease